VSKPAIVCVDDEPIVLDGLKEQFRRQFGREYAIEVAQDAEEALEVLEQLRGDDVHVPVVISDHIMPGMKGDELLIEVHKRLPQTRTILLTGQAGPDAVGNVVNLGQLYRYIAKPWDREDLALTVRGAVQSYFGELEVERQRAELEATHQAGRRFVPFEVLNLLGRERLLDVRRGDAAAHDMGIFFSDIRGYTTLVEGKSPTENFAFINEYIEHMERPIEAQGGFIDSLSGDGILALFEGGADAVVRAGLDTLAALDDYNRHREGRGERAVRIGIGANVGPLMMGVVGGEQRLKVGVIGDPVNLAARLETLTKQLGALFLISEETRDVLEDAERYTMRFVDLVRVKGRARPVSVFEVLDGLSAAERDAKLAAHDRFTAAREAFVAGEMAEAKRGFEQAAEHSPGDRAIEVHIRRCERHLARGVPEGWQGITDLEEK
jgi:class 3 adenylate cyclase